MMQKPLSLLLACGGLCVQAAPISSAGIVADGSGTRVVFRVGQEPLSRVISEADGTLRIEIQGSTTLLEGHHDLSPSGPFASVDAASLQREGSSIAVFRFHPAKGSAAKRVLHREWDGQDIAFLLDKAPAKNRTADLWSVPVAGARESVVLAALSVAPHFESARAWGSGDMETIELKFSTPPLEAQLSGSGKNFVVDLGKAKPGKVAIPVAASRLIQSVTPGKEGEFKLTLKEDARSVLLTRSGSTVAIRLVATGPIAKPWVWNGAKLETFGGSALPSDEVANISGLRKDLKLKGGEGFSADGGKGATAQGMVASGTAASSDKASIAEAQKLEAERRKSQEITDHQVAEQSAQKAEEDKKNKVTYNTFGIRDPFIPLEPDDAEGGLNIDQMRVVGIIASPTRPMAVLEHTTQPGLSVALREGDAIQNGRVLKIERDRVVFLLEEFGVSRQFALKLQAPKGEKS